jgi:uncharacterized repeat protein (TIGR03843 family)
VPTPERDLPELGAVSLDGPTALRLLRDGDVELVGRLVVSSNNALLGTLSLGAVDGQPALSAPAVYKPIAGERPLWDFPDGTLAAREVASFVVSQATPWAIVPPTVLRDGPFGPGMVQLWLEPDPAVDRVALVVDGDERLRPMALFDAVVNNADRKVGHLLPMDDGHIFGVDHGICFHEEPKLRTVLWRWAGTPLNDAECEALRGLRVALAGEMGRSLGRLLTRAEIRATVLRLDALLATAVFPAPDPDRPALPWPPY